MHRQKFADFRRSKVPASNVLSKATYIFKIEGATTSLLQTSRAKSNFPSSKPRLSPEQTSKFSREFQGLDYPNYQRG